jgi:hypothetical protein
MTSLVLKDQKGPKSQYPTAIPTSPFTDKRNKQEWQSLQGTITYAICLHIVQGMWLTGGINNNVSKVGMGQRVFGTGIDVRGSETSRCCVAVGDCNYLSTHLRSDLYAIWDRPQDKGARMSYITDEPVDRIGLRNFTSREIRKGYNGVPHVGLGCCNPPT